jgi:hypothetical protein
MARRYTVRLESFMVCLCECMHSGLCLSELGEYLLTAEVRLGCAN